MSRILAFTSGPEDWQKLLSDPIKHWKTGYSARTLAFSWEEADGFPAEITAAFSQTKEPLLANTKPIIAVPEFKVPLNGGIRPSQNDIFVLAQSLMGPITIMVEGKVNESFGPTLDEWLIDVSPGKDERFNFLLRSLGLRTIPAGTTRYQLLHRAASAVITGEQYRAAACVLLIHSFSNARTGWTDYQAFTKLFGVEANYGEIQRLGTGSNIPLFGVWVEGNPSYLES